MSATRTLSGVHSIQAVWRRVRSLRGPSQAAIALVLVGLVVVVAAQLGGGDDSATQVSAAGGGTKVSLIPPRTEANGSPEQPLALTDEPPSGTTVTVAPTTNVSLIPPATEVNPANPPCTPGYDPCIADLGTDVDCAGSGDGPREVKGPVRVDDAQGDPYDLDPDHNGVGCER